MPRPTPPSDRVLARRRELGEQIRRVRMDRNLTQLDVCRRSGLDVATYSRIEQGHASPLFDTLVRIADAIGVGEVDLMPDPAAGPGETPTAGR